MAITLKALQPLSEKIGGTKFEMDWSGGTLGDLVFSLIKKRGPELEKELKEGDGSLAYLVSVNGRIKRDLSTTIQDGDEIFFFTPLGGG
jgi:molybdopterin converting factor small subunit